MQHSPKTHVKFNKKGQKGSNPSSSIHFKRKFSKSTRHDKSTPHPDQLVKLSNSYSLLSLLKPSKVYMGISNQKITIKTLLRQPNASECIKLGRPNESRQINVLQNLQWPDLIRVQNSNHA